MTDQEPQRKKGGRPRKYAPNAKRPTMAFRMSSELHEKLIAAAAERSLSEEIERRLEESFKQEEITDAVAKATSAAVIETTRSLLTIHFGGERGLYFGQVMGSALRSAMQAVGMEDKDYRDLRNNPEALSFVDKRLKDRLTREISGDTIEHDVFKITYDAFARGMTKG